VTLSVINIKKQQFIQLLTATDVLDISGLVFITMQNLVAINAVVLII